MARFLCIAGARERPGNEDDFTSSRAHDGEFKWSFRRFKEGLKTKKQTKKQKKSFGTPRDS